MRYDAKARLPKKGDICVFNGSTCGMRSEILGPERVHPNMHDIPLGNCIGINPRLFSLHTNPERCPMWTDGDDKGCYGYMLKSGVFVLANEIRKATRDEIKMEIDDQKSMRKTAVRAVKAIQSDIERCDIFLQKALSAIRTRSF